MSISANEARANLYPLIKKVHDDHDVVHITSRQHGNAVLMSEEDWNGWMETVYLMRSPANASRLLDAVARDQTSGEAVTTSMDELVEWAEDE
ncbi:type II toxin-antitoxin system Phd/YefM family antitoxin [Nocardiopsis sp. NRRL B-16309]|uniref:type II toxin-antitoxin system Phd/YefM family antitoxin n=1 Tax=Nocardiopsis sp. NRRL B-16309 TaxID=1519494 RepID=UPI0006ADA5FE|nr:type II toxin-antitoxin system Phd/YefM family antitoxin [Nocardiopsis sp. NRRL B-16309]KOX22215.1 antitoxin [Nocardiopsis sp. NRRL B-16309]